MMQKNDKATGRPNPRAALIRLLLVLAVTVGFVIFAYGWTVTDIDLDRPQEPQRQQNVGNALRELLSPNVFTQDYETESIQLPFVMGCPEGFTTPPVESADGEEYIVIEPACGDASDKVTVSGYGFPGTQLARVNWIPAEGERRTRRPEGLQNDTFTTQPDGTFRVVIEVPRIRGTDGQTHAIQVQVAEPVGSPRWSDTTLIVFDKMLETIFLALIATAVSILPSAILSFFAAHNLMKPIRMSLGSLLVNFSLLPVGAVVATLLLLPLARAVFEGSSGVLFGTGAGFIVIFGMVSTSRKLSLAQRQERPGITRRVIMTVVIAVLVVLGLALLGGLGVLFGRLFTVEQHGILGHISGLIGSLGQMIQLTLPLIVSVTGAVAMASIGGTLTNDALKRISGTANYVLAGILGAISGAILMAICAAIANTAAWLGLLPPVVAGALGAGLLPMIYRRIIGHRVVRSTGEKITSTLLGWLGAAVAAFITFTWMNIGQAIISGALPSQIPVFSALGFDISQYMLISMIIGAVLGGALGAMAGVRAAFPLGNVMYNITRTVLNGLRSIEPLIMGLVFVIWVGIGPFAGVLALALHSIASLGKLYSEQIESIDTGPIEALQSTGANRLQTIMYAVVPQIIPPYIAFTMYRWDINVRMSTIIGFVGGGGIGFLLQQQINLLRYRDAGVAVLAIAIVVSILDYASAAIRSRVL